MESEPNVNKHLSAVRQRTISMSSNTASTTDSMDSRTIKSVRFYPVVRVAMLPLQEREDARRARSGQWKPAPMSDELWDGEYMAFREVELTPEEFKKLTNPNKRRKTPLPRSFASMFSKATSGQQKDGELAGVDIIHARARVYAEDFDEFERDSFGRLDTKDSSDDDVDKEEYCTQDASSERDHIVLKISAEEIGDDYVIKFVPQTDGTATPPPPPPPTKRPSAEKLTTTKFVPSPPSEPSPSEIAGLIVPLPQKKKSSTLSAASMSSTQSFICGEGKRSTLLLGEEPIKEEYEQWEEEEPGAQPKKTMKKKRSILGMMMGALSLAVSS